MKREELGLNFGNDNMEEVMRMAVREAAKYDQTTLSLRRVDAPRHENEDNMFYHPDPVVRRIYRRAIMNDPVL